MVKMSKHLNSQIITLLPKDETDATNLIFNEIFKGIKDYRGFVPAVTSTCFLENDFQTIIERCKKYGVQIAGIETRSAEEWGDRWAYIEEIDRNEKDKNIYAWCDRAIEDTKNKKQYEGKTLLFLGSFYIS